MGWRDDIIEAFRSIGGEGHYDDIYEAIAEIRGGDNLPKTWKAIVRAEIEKCSSDSELFDKKNDLFYTVEGIGKGIWGLRNYDPDIEPIDLTEDDLGFPEGKKLLREHIQRERNPKLVKEAKRKFKEKHGKLFCEICEFCFNQKYGKIGEDFIEAHHTKPISDLQPGEKTKIDELVMVCSNCHRMLHRKRPWLHKDELKLLIVKH
ncbi:MAG: HNH endonuclease [Flavobacteriaceae bacterium]|jgi:putative restriction endonuclease|nr:HNH endonuclease [Flavobacteriaceae bacterium]